MKNKAGLLLPFIFFSLLLAGMSCNGRPSNVLSEDKMVNLLVDMELTESYANTQMAASSKDKLEMGKRVLRAHGVTEEELDTTLAWYGRNMDDYAALFEKVDKEINKRKKKYTEQPGMKPIETDNLWPYPTHLIISPLSGDETFTFSFPVSDMEKGKIMEFSFFLPNAATLKTTFGVEYSDGHGEAVITNTNNRNKVDISLQTDTAKEVSRLFGVMHLKDAAKVLPLYIDSITLKAEAFDSLSYHQKKRSQKHFGILRQQKAPEKPVVKDSIESDSKNVELKDSIVKKEPEKIEGEKMKTIPVKREMPGGRRGTSGLKRSQG